ncbi:MAG: serine/threonine protein kinase [Candidatus Obscuribacterales bacterium]|nr:serine/threonine protein kinase [Candidatus Obscuribacterales bacterium]
MNSRNHSSEQCRRCGNEAPHCSCWNSEAKPRAAARLVEPGDIINQKYQIIRQVGQGATSTIYLVRHVVSDKLFAMKMLIRDIPNFEEKRLRFEREANAIGSLNHENLVSLYDFGISSSGHLFFITDFLEGKSLFKLLRMEKFLKWDHACRVFLQVCSAMHYAHLHGLIHRDLKPSNIMLIAAANNIELVKVVDFGIVQFDDSHIAGELNERLTQEGTVVGSPNYMSPEQCQGHKVDHRSDVYSLGCLMFETLTGEIAFPGDTPMSILLKQVTDPPPSMNEFIGVPAELGRIVLKTLAKDPQERYQTMEDLQAAISRFAQLRV